MPIRRFFGLKGGKKKEKKKRLSPSAQTAEGMRDSHPMYQYALNEFAQAVPPASGNDDGRSVVSSHFESSVGEPLWTASRSQSRDGDDDRGQGLEQQQHKQQQQQQKQQSQEGQGAQEGGQEYEHQERQQQQQQKPPGQEAEVNKTESFGSSYPYPTYSTQPQPPPPPPPPPLLNSASKESTQVNPATSMSGAPSISFSPTDDSFLDQAESIQQARGMTYRRHKAQHHLTMPDATYEEHYGDAYIGGPIKYIYPSGYQSMRPRGGPWKLSIAVCVSFTWLSVFIIGYCSDLSGDFGDELEDDTLAIEVRWCGSHLLYFMWVISMSIMGLASAYCGVIGYIKVRDFAVANSRSQPPGMMGKSDYYVNIDDQAPHLVSQQHSHSQNQYDSARSFVTDASGRIGPYRKTIYQSDGAPQFWGSHIYRPTQAAVAITSR